MSNDKMNITNSYKTNIYQKEKNIPMTTSNPILEKVEELRRGVDVQHMLEGPFFQHLEKFALNDTQMQTFFVDYYSIVRTSYRMLAAGILSANAENIETIQHLVEILSSESGEPNHMELYFRWASHFDITMVDLQTARPNPSALVFEGVLMDYYSSRDDLTKLAAQLAVEDCAEVLIKGLDRGFRKYQLPTRAYAYLAAHLVIENDEEGHSRWCLNSLAKRSDVLDRFADVEHIYLRIYEAFCGVFNGIYQAWSNQRMVA